MTKDISKKITVFAWAYIIILMVRSLLSANLALSYSFLSRQAILGIILYIFLTGILTIVFCINLMQHKEWARKACIILTAIQLCYVLIVSVPVNAKFAHSIKAAQTDITKIKTGYESLPEEVRGRANITQQGYENIVVNTVQWMGYLILGFFAGFLILGIMFLTGRPLKESLQQDINFKNVKPVS